MDHITKIQNAIEFIESHLENDLSVDDICKVAGFSKWHFQMIFSSVTGESLKEYIRKRRLSEAMLKLGDKDKKIIDIAVEAGFESQESFTRAFKLAFGVNPAECRLRGIKNFSIMKKKKITMEYLDHLYKGVAMKPVIKEIKSFTIVGLGTRFISILSPEKNNHILLPQLWQKYIQLQHTIFHRKNAINYGVCFVQPKEQRQHPDECYYIAGAEVTSVENLPLGMEKITIEAGRYAIFTHKGPLNEAIANLEHTMNYIYGSWLPKSGFELRDAPEFELYDERFHPASPESEFDIYIPIK